MSELHAPRPFVSMWRSSTLRLALLLTLVLWFLAVLVANGVYDRSEDALLARATEELDEHVEWVRELLERPFPPAGFEADFEDVPGAEPLELEEDDEDALYGSLATFLGAYTRAVNEAIVEAREDGDVRSVEYLTARLWLLGEPTGFAPRELGPEGVLGIMEEEIPERFHEALLTLAEERIEAWPEDPSWQQLDDRERVERIVETLELHDEGFCIGWLAPDETLVDANFEPRAESEITRAGYRLLHVHMIEGERDEAAASCWLRPLPLNGGIFVLGVRFDEAATVLEDLRRVRDEGVVLMLLVAIVAGSLIARALLGRLRRINDTFTAVAAGDLAARIPTGRGRDDFSRLSAHINDALDRIEHLMSGVRAVSDNIAHDLRTPLTRLRNRIELLAQQGGGDPRLIEQVTEEADRLLAIFEGLLRIAQLEQGTYRRAFSEFDLRATVADAVDLYEPSITEKGIRLEVDLPDRPLPVLGDRDLWLQAVSNLLDNAMKYTPADGMVEVRLARTAKGWGLTLADTGQGIPPEERERVLQRFYRLEAHRGTEGSGLGLSLVAAVCGLHGARLELGGDHGLTVSIRHPDA